VRLQASSPPEWMGLLGPGTRDPMLRKAEFPSPTEGDSSTSVSQSPYELFRGGYSCNPAVERMAPDGRMAARRATWRNTPIATAMRKPISSVRWKPRRANRCGG